MKKLRILIPLLLAFVFFNACSSDDDNTTPPVPIEEYNSEVVVSWYTLIKKLTTETPGYTPPVAARAFGYTGIALYESIQLGTPTMSSLSGRVNGMTLTTSYDASLEYHWPTVANATLAHMTKAFYINASEENLSNIAALEGQLNQEFELEATPEVLERSRLLAVEVGEKILTWASTDGGHDGQFSNFHEDYVPLEGEQYWQPTVDNGYTPALQPYWGENRPFIIANVTDAIPVDPPPYSTDPTSICYQRALAVHDVVNNITPEQTIIAEFWSDDPQTTATPPGHSISILNQLIAENEYNLLQSSEAFAKLAIGINDAFISCWKTKYATNYPRPITYINQHINADWSPILITPPFPEYTSGHSVQSGVLARILTSMFGESYSFTDRTHENRTDIDGTPRNYATFYEMAEEAALSRLYGGIHYQEAIDIGLTQGYEIGDNVLALFEN